MSQNSPEGTSTGQDQAAEANPPEPPASRRFRFRLPLHKSIKENWDDVVGDYLDVGNAFVWLSLVLLGLVIVYAVWHVLLPAPDHYWNEKGVYRTTLGLYAPECTPDADGGTQETGHICEDLVEASRHLNDGECTGVCLSGYGVLDVRLDSTKLLQFLNPAQLKGFEDHFQSEDIKAYRDSIIEQRRSILKGYHKYIEDYYGPQAVYYTYLLHDDAPGKIGTIGLLELATRLHDLQKLCARYAPGEGDVDCFDLTRRTSADVSNWRRSASDANPDDKGTTSYFDGSEGKSRALFEMADALSPPRRELFAMRTKVLVQLLTSTIVSEVNLFRNLRQLAPDFQPSLAFDWVRIDNSFWVLEVMFWTWFGVLAKAHTMLMVAYTAKAYEARLFVLVLPRMVIAPLMSIILFAALASGVTTSGFNFLNIAFFLLASFVMGYGSERVSRLIAQLTRNILGGLRFSSSKTRNSLGLKSVYQLENPVPQPIAGQRPETIAQLKDLAVAVARNSVEKDLLRSP